MTHWPTSTKAIISKAFQPSTLSPPFGLADFVDAFGGSHLNRHLKHVQNWAQLDIASLVDDVDGGVGSYIGFMQGRMFQAYVPAWLTYTLQADAPDLDALSALATSLEPDLSFQIWSEDRFTDRKRTLNEDQCKAIVAFGLAIKGNSTINGSVGKDLGMALVEAWDS